MTTPSKNDAAPLAGGAGVNGSNNPPDTTSTRLPLMHPLRNNSSEISADSLRLVIDSARPRNTANGRLAAVRATRNHTGKSKGGGAVTETSIFDYLKAAREARTLSKCAKAMLFGLVSYLDGRSGNAWPSVKTLQIATGWSRRAVQNGIDELAAAGVVEIIGGRAGGVGPGGRGISNRFMVKLPVLIAMGAPRAPVKGARDDREACTECLGSAHPMSRKGAPGAPEKDKERDKEVVSKAPFSLDSVSGHQSKSHLTSDEWDLDAVYSEGMNR